MSYYEDESKEILIPDRYLIRTTVLLITAGIWIYVFYLLGQNILSADTVDPRIKELTSSYMIGYAELVIGIMIATLIGILIRNHYPKKHNISRNNSK